MFFIACDPGACRGRPKETAAMDTRPTHEDGRPALRLLPCDEDLAIPPKPDLMPGPNTLRIGDLMGLGYMVTRVNGATPWLAERPTEFWAQLFFTRAEAWRACHMRALDHANHQEIPTKPGPDLPSGILDMIRRGVITPETAPDDFGWIEEMLGAKNVADALKESDLQPFEDLARAAEALVEAVDRIDHESLGNWTTAIDRSSLVRLSRCLEPALETYRKTSGLREPANPQPHPPENPHGISHDQL
jgi:hypothetical protein